MKIGKREYIVDLKTLADNKEIMKNKFILKQVRNKIIYKNEDFKRSKIDIQT